MVQRKIQILILFIVLTLSMAFSIISFADTVVVPDADIIDFMFDNNTVTDEGNYNFKVQRLKGGNIEESIFFHKGLTYRGLAFNKSNLDQNMAVNWLSEDTADFRNLFYDGFSMELAFQIPKYERTDAVLMGNTNSGGVNLKLVYENNKRYIGLAIHDGSKYINIKNSVAVEENELYHVSAVFSKEEKKVYLYVNGQLVDSAEMSAFKFADIRFGMAVGGLVTGLYNPDGAATIAYDTYRSDLGLYTSAKMYSDALTDAQVKKTYDNFINSLEKVEVNSDVATIYFEDGALVDKNSLVSITEETAEIQTTTVMYGEKAMRRDAMKLTYENEGAVINFGDTMTGKWQDGYSVGIGFSVNSLPESEWVLLGNDNIAISLTSKGNIKITQGEVSVELTETVAVNQIYYVNVTYDGRTNKIVFYLNGENSGDITFSDTVEEPAFLGVGGISSKEGIINSDKKFENGNIYAVNIYSEIVEDEMILPEYRNYIYGFKEILADEVVDVINLIDSIGTVTKDSVNLLNNIKNKYSLLNGYQKTQVSNYGKYVEAVAVIDIVARDEATFDESNIIYTFASLSDTHIGRDDNSNKFRNALEIVQEKATNGIDAFLFSGDQTQNGYYAEAQEFANIVREYYNPTQTPIIITHGNHDTYWTNNISEAEFVEAYGSDIFTFDRDMLSIYDGNRHVKAGGFDFLAVQMSVYASNNNVMSAATKKWLVEKLDEITSENPFKPVFLAIHSPASNTVIGSNDSDDTGIWGSSKELQPILNNYPQVICFSGHTHYFSNDERAIWQDGATYITVPSVSDPDYNKGYLEFASGISDAMSYSQGMIVEIDVNNNVRIKRVDFKEDKEIKQPWIIPAPQEDGSHLLHYTGYRYYENQAPVFDENSSVSVDYITSRRIEIVYDIAIDDDMVHEYLIEIIKDGKVKEEIKSIAPWYDYPNLADMPNTRSMLIYNFTIEQPYSVRVTAIDSWGAKSIPLEVTVSTESDTIDIAKATEFDSSVGGLSNLAKEDIDKIIQIRKLYESLTPSQKIYVKRYSDFEEIEQKFYKDFYFALDPSALLLTKENITLDSSKVSFAYVKETDGSVVLNWDYANSSHSLKIDNSLLLKETHLYIANLNINSENKKLYFAFIGENNKGQSGIVIDFSVGKVFARINGEDNEILSNDLLLYSNIVAQPFVLTLSQEGVKVTLKIATVKEIITSQSFTFSDSSVQIAIFPEGNGFTGKMEIYGVKGIKADVSKLKSLIDSCRDLKEEDYTKESWALYSESLTNAKNLIHIPAIDEETATSAYVSLSNAVNTLAEFEKSGCNSSLLNGGGLVSSLIIVCLALVMCFRGKKCQ